jgi:Tol biopolymer transport system component
MSPEQAAADKHIDHRADIYAVGALAYEVLTGRPPFTGTTPQEVLAAHVTKAVEPVTEHRGTVPPALAQLVMKCLEKKPADRWQTAEELLPHLEALATPSGGVTPTGVVPVARVAKRRWMMAGGAVGVAAVLLAIVAVLPRLMAPSPVTITTSNVRAVTSEPGMEWQPALSPDGSQVAFVANRDGRQAVVIRSTRTTVRGGEVRPTQGAHAAQEWIPAWSPDGETVHFYACARGYTGCTWMQTGRFGGLIIATDLPRTEVWPSWSPDGSRVALLTGGINVNWGFTRGDSILTYSITDSTTTLIAVPEVTSGLNTSPAWSPDGRWIAYVAGSASFFDPDWLTSSSIWMVDADGGEPVRVTGYEFYDISPVWLDADHLLFVSDRDGRREVYVIEVTPRGPRGPPRKVAGLADAHTISYSIAGRKLAFARATTRQNVWSYPIRPGTVSIADGHPVTAENAIIEAHDLSPDGSWIVYSSDLGHPGNSDLYRKPLDGGSPTLLAESPRGETDPGWSPDGTEIAFAAVGDPMRMMVVSADGGTPVQVASAPQTWLPVWSPSGLELAFLSSQSGQFETWVVPREAIGRPWGEAMQLTDFGCWLSDWAPDGGGVLCSVGGGSGETVLVSRGGEVLWRYDPSTAGLELSNTYQRFSADGSVVYAAGRHEDGTEGIWAIRVQGGEPRLVVAYDDDELTAWMWLSVGRDHLYLTVRQTLSDIWVADVEVER